MYRWRIVRAGISPSMKPLPLPSSSHPPFCCHGQWLSEWTEMWRTSGSICGARIRVLAVRLSRSAALLLTESRALTKAEKLSDAVESTTTPLPLPSPQLLFCCQTGSRAIRLTEPLPTLRTTSKQPLPLPPPSILPSSARVKGAGCKAPRHCGPLPHTSTPCIRRLSSLNSLMPASKASTACCGRPLASLPEKDSEISTASSGMDSTA